MVTTGAIAKVLPYMRTAAAAAARGSVTSWCPLSCPHRAAGLLAPRPSGDSPSGAMPAWPADRVVRPASPRDPAEQLTLPTCLGSCGYRHANCGRLARLPGAH